MTAPSELREVVARIVEGAIADAMNGPWEDAAKAASDAILSLPALSGCGVGVTEAMVEAGAVAIRCADNCNGPEGQSCGQCDDPAFAGCRVLARECLEAALSLLPTRRDEP